MGEAKRRKLLDPEYGKSHRVADSITHVIDNQNKDDFSHLFKIYLKSKVIDSWVTVHVINTAQTREAILSVELETDIEPIVSSLGTFFFVIDKDYQIVLLVL